MSLLLTGVSGFIGAQVLVRLLKDPRHDKIHVLLRESRGKSAQDRLQQIIIDLFPPSEREFARSKIKAIAGDMTAKGLGIEGDTRDQLISELRQVIHCSASTKFDEDLEVLRATNVEGTKALLVLAKEAKDKHRKFERFAFVSTAYVAGREGNVVTEAQLDRDQEFSNNYEQSKFEAEKAANLYRPFFPVTIIRPSIVVGQSTNGYTPHFRVLYWPLKLIARGYVPLIPSNLNAELDVVPADYVADGIMALAFNKEADNHTHHLTAGLGNEVSVGDLLGHAEVARAIPKRVKIPLWVFRSIQYSPVRYLFPKSFWELTEKAAPYTAYLEGTGTRYDNTKTEALLAKLGVKRPTWDDYKDRIFHYARATDWGRVKLGHDYNYLGTDFRPSQRPGPDAVQSDATGTLAHSAHPGQ